MFSNTGGQSPIKSHLGARFDLTKSQTSKERPSLYFSNGTGRDTYIFNDNGGLSLPYKPNEYDKPARFLPRVNRDAAIRRP